MGFGIIEEYEQVDLRKNYMLGEQTCLLRAIEMPLAVNLAIRGIDPAMLIKRIAKVSQDARNRQAWYINNVVSSHRGKWFLHG
jgi:hypothetical protein